MRIEILSVGPQLAARWLATVDETTQRPVAPSTVAKYARDMEAGRWLLTGDTVKHSASGHLIDGRTRMEAILVAGIAVTMAVAFDVEPAAVTAIDRGRPRSMRNVFHLAGWDGRAERAGELARLRLGLNTRTAIPQPDSVLLAHAEEHTTSYSWACSLQSAIPGLTRAPVRLALAEYYERDAPAAEAAAHALLVGSGLGAGSPVLALRNYLLAKHSRRELQSIVYRKAVCALKACAECRPLVHLREATW